MFMSARFLFSSGLYLLLLVGCKSAETFTNPLLPQGADPWCIYKDGYYYYTNSTQDNITLWKTKSIAKLPQAEKKVVFTPAAGTPYSKELWAPEIHFLQGKWYIYFAADSGKNIDHRMYVLENASPDPLQGEWVMKGKLITPEDKWSIDGTVFDHNGQLYMLWSGWEGNTNKQQDIYMAAMSNPWTISGKRVRLSAPTYDWETHGDLNDPNDVPHVNVNEGPQILKHKDKLYLIYSASGCWTDFYSLGMLQTSINANIMDSAAWTKNATPVFTQSAENGVYAPGHNSFFVSPNGKQHWILYHANDKPGQGCGNFRSPRAQQFTWKKDGSPYFGKPVAAGKAIRVPK
jgi:GH43 family beta-xylosidase